MRKKILTGILLGSMLLFAVGCNKKEEKNTEKDSKKDVTQEVQQESVTPKEPSVKVMDVYTIGSYEQDADTENGAEVLEWLVLEVKDNKALLISRYGLEAMPFNETEEAMTWEKCSLRTWLNSEFYETAFSEEEKEKIKKTTVLNNADANGGVDGGTDTEDQVFLLSVEEARKYFGEDGVEENGRNYNLNRATTPTEYAKTKPLTIISGDKEYAGCSPYWLRTPGVAAHIAAIVDYNGDIYAFGHGVSEPKNMVRPAIWVEITEE